MPCDPAHTPNTGISQLANIGMRVTIPVTPPDAIAIPMSSGSAASRGALSQRNSAEREARAPKARSPPASASPPRWPAGPPTTPRQTQRLAATQLLTALRQTTAIGADTPLAVDEVLQFATNALYGMNDELAQSQKANTELRAELAAAYRASSSAAASSVAAARRETELAEMRERAAEQAAAVRQERLEGTVNDLLEQQRALEHGNQQLTRGLDAERAACKVLQRRLNEQQEAARSVLQVLPPLPEEETRMAELLAAVAAGEAVHQEEDCLAMLARCAERGKRVVALSRSGSAAHAQLQGLIDDERASASELRETIRCLEEDILLLRDANSVLRVEAADAVAGAQAADDGVRRLQHIVQRGEVAPAPAGPSPPLAASPARGGTTHAATRDAEQAVVGLEAAVRQTAELLQRARITPTK